MECVANGLALHVNIWVEVVVVIVLISFLQKKFHVVTFFFMQYFFLQFLPLLPASDEESGGWVEEPSPLLSYAFNSD